MNKILFLSFFIISNTVYADSCGIGKVTQVLEGGWNTEDFMVKIDYSVASSLHPGTEFNGYIVFKSTLNVKRYNGIKSIALSALMTGKTVKPYSHNNNCSNATQIAVFNE